MKAKLILIPCIFAMASVSAFAQARKVTNFELEKYRQQRVQAEKDLNENYKALGFASPEERERRLEAWKKESQELSDKWTRERIERENADAISRQASALAAQQQQYYPPTQTGYPVYDSGLVFSYGFSNPFGFHNRFRFRPFTQGLPAGYFAGGAFWPAPSPVRIPLMATPTRPVTRPRH